MDERIVDYKFKRKISKKGLRPRCFDEYIGQEKVKENLMVFIEAAKQRKEPLDHVLLYGPPGLGKPRLQVL